MSVNPKTLVEKFIKDSKGRKRFTAITSMLAVFTVLITVGVLTFPAISISGSEEALREQGIDITAGQTSEATEEVVAPPADEAPIVAYDEASQAPDAESNENVAEAITEETQIGDVVVSGEEEAEAVADAPAEGEAIEDEASSDAPAEGEEVSSSSEATEAEEADKEKDAEKDKKEEIEASDAAKSALAAADLSSQRLIVGSPSADALAEETNVVANFDNVYLLQYASAEEAKAGFLKFFDASEYVTPDVAVEIAEGEDNSDPEEEIITTNNVYTEEENPFAELETALVEETTAEADAAAESNDVALIALIDTGAEVNANVVEAVSMLGEETRDDNGHGLNMVDYIVAENEAAQILSIKALGADGKGDVSAVVAAINYAKERGASIINLSMSAYASEENAALAEAVKAAEEAGIVVVGAAGNNGFNAKFYIPGNIEEATIVGAADAEGNRIAQSNFGETVDYNVVSESTSEAAARMSGFVSVNGEAAIEEALNQGFVFSTNYVAPAPEEGAEEAEAEAEAEATPESAEDTDTQMSIASSMDAPKPQSEATSQRDWLKAQKNTNGSTVTVHTWDALKDVIENTNATTIILDGSFGGIAAYDTVTVKSGHNVTIKAGTANTIYHDASPAATMTSYFKVENGGTLNLEGVTLTGKKATSAVAEPLGNATIEYRGGNYEVVLYDPNNGEHWLDSYDNIGSVKAVKRGTTDDMPVQQNGFTIRAKEKNANGNYVFLGGSHGQPKAFEVAPNQVASKTNTNDYKWEFVTTDNGTYLYQATSGISISYDGYKHGKPSATKRLEVKPQNAAYTMNSIENGYFVDVETGGTLNVKNSILENADGGAAPIYVKGGTANILGSTEIRNNKARKTPAVQNSGWDNTSGPTWESWTNSIHNWRDSAINAVRSEEWNTAGAVVVASGGTLNLGSENKAEGVPQIYSNHGQAGAIRAIGGATVHQYHSIIGGSAAAKGNVGGEGGAAHISGNTTSYYMHSGEMAYNYSIVTGGGICVDGDAAFYMGHLAADGITGQNPLDAPIIQHNTAIAGDGGAVQVNSNNVFLYNGEIAHNRSYKMGGGLYVVGDSPTKTKIISFPKYNGVTNAYVYDNYAFGGGYWDGAWLNGDGGGLWFCDFGSYLYDEDYLEVFRNIAGVKKDTRERMSATDGDRQDKQYLGNGDDFSKQGAKKAGEGIGADFIIKDEHVWTFDRPDRRNGPSATWTYSIYNNGTTLDPASVFPTTRDMNLKNSFNMDTNTLDPKNKLIIHDNNAPLGGGIGCNGVIVFGEVPLHYKKVEADLVLDKKWVESGQETNVDNKQVALKVEILNDKNEVQHTYDVTLDGKTSDSVHVSPSTPDMITRNKWRVSIDLPTYTFQIDEELLEAAANNPVLAEQLKNKGSHSEVYKAQKNITTDRRNSTNLDYGEPEGANKEFDVNGYIASIAFDNWKIRVTETLLDQSGQPVSSGNTYAMSMSDLYFAQSDNSSVYTDTGSNFFVYTDTYTLSADIINTRHDVTVNKVDDKGQPLTGAKFSLYSIKDGEETLVETLPADGEEATSNITFTGLAVGDYKIVESSAPEGYTKFPSAIYFTVDREKGVVHWRNEYTAVDEEGQLYINGNKLYLDKLIWVDNNSVSDWKDANNITTTPSPYTLKLRGKGDVKVTSLSGNANTKYLVTTNVNGIQRYMQDRKWNYSITKSDMTLPSVHPDKVGENSDTFNSYYNREAYLWAVEDVDGYMILKTHYAKNYLVLDENGNPSITSDVNVAKTAAKNTATSGVSFDEETFTFTVPNVEKKGRASVLKVDENNRPLAGALLELLDSKGNAVQVQDENGNPIFENGQPKMDWLSTTELQWFNLPVGTYTLREKRAPDNYVTAASITFEVTNTGYAAITMVDKSATPGNTYFYKKEEGSEKAVVGAKLQLQYVEVTGHTEGDVHSEWVTETTPHMISDLKPGRYRLVEIEAPLGYEINTEGVEFIVPKYSSSNTSALPVSAGNDYEIAFTKESGALQTMEIKYGNDANVAYCIDYQTASYGAESAKRYDFTATGIDGANLSNESNLLKNREAIMKVLWLGYPNDALGLIDKMPGNNIQSKEIGLRLITQALIWNYANPGSMTDSQVKTYIHSTASENASRYTWYSKIKDYIDKGILFEEGDDPELYAVPDNFKVGFYSQPGHQPAIETYAYPKTISVTMRDEAKKGSLEVVKTWFEADGEQVINGDDDRLSDISITIELWRGVEEAIAVDNGSSQDTQTEYVLGSREKVEGPIVLTAADNWKKLFENLPIVNGDGKPYYYYVVEHAPSKPFELVEVGEPVVLQDDTEKNIISINPTDTISAWTEALSATTASNMFEGGRTYVFACAAEYTSNPLALAKSGTTTAYVRLSRGNPANASAESKWIAEAVPGKSNTFYLKNAAGGYILLGGRSYYNTNYYSYTIGTNGTKAEMALVKGDNGYYTLQCTNTGYSGKWAIGNDVGWFAKGSGVSFRAFVQEEITLADVTQDAIDVAADKETWVHNKNKVYDFELVKIDSSKLNDVLQSASNLANEVDNDAALQAIANLVGEDKMLNGAIFELKPVDGAGSDETTQTIEGINGRIQFTGVQPGAYVLTEKKSPDNYSAINGSKTWYVNVSDDGVVSIASQGSTNGEGTEFVTIGGHNIIVLANTLDVYILPSTGGVGTHVFAIIGGLMMLVAGALWVRRTGRQGA